MDTPAPRGPTAECPRGGVDPVLLGHALPLQVRYWQTTCPASEEGADWLVEVLEYEREFASAQLAFALEDFERKTSTTEERRPRNQPHEGPSNGAATAGACNEGRMLNRVVENSRSRTENEPCIDLVTPCAPVGYREVGPLPRRLLTDVKATLRRPKDRAGPHGEW